MKTIRIANELYDGPIWTLDENGYYVDDLPIIKNDSIIKELRDKISNMWDSYIEFDSHDQACWFNKELFLKNIPVMLDLIKQLKNRLNEINDGSYLIEDIETDILNEYLKNNK